MSRVENRGKKAIRVGQQATRCAQAQPTKWSDAVAPGAKKKRIETKLEKLEKQVSRLVGEAGKVSLADPRGTKIDIPRSTPFANTAAPKVKNCEGPRMGGYRWSEQRIQAADLVAAGDLTDLEIAAKVGISDRQLRRWKRIPEFWAVVQEHVAAHSELITKAAVRHWLPPEK